MIKLFIILESQDVLANILKQTKTDKETEVVYLLDDNKKEFPCVLPLSKMELKITDMLHILGISPKYKGYLYLKDAITSYYNSPCSISTIYMILSSKYKVSPSCIERGICRVIETGFTRNDIDDVINIFGNSICCNRGCPTNLEAITTIVERLKNML